MSIPIDNAEVAAEGYKQCVHFNAQRGGLPEKPAKLVNRRISSASHRVHGLDMFSRRFRDLTKSCRLPIGMLVSAAVALGGCSEASSSSEIKPVDVDVSRVLAKRIRHWDEFNGRISAVQSVDIRPRVSGYVDHVAYKEGSEVRKGDLLFTIDPRPYEAAVKSAVARLQRAQATASLAVSRDRRAQILVKTRDVVSQEEADDRHATQLQTQAEVLDAEATVAVATLNREFTEVRAPISGRVSRALLTAGNLAVADQTLLTTLVSQDPVYVDFDPDEHSYLRYGAQAKERADSTKPLTVRVGLANEQGFPHGGKVDFEDNKLDAATGSIRLRARLANRDHLFTPGLYARVQVSNDRETEALLIDDKAVLTDQDRKYVYVVGADNKAQRKDIEPGEMSDGLRVIKAGLTSTDRVVVGGLQRIFASGVLVRPSEQSLAQTAK